MSATQEKSPFVESALQLNEDFTQIERLSGELERLDIGTDNGLERARLLLGRFSECSERIGDDIQSLSKALSDAQARAGEAAQAVATRALQVQERQLQADALLKRFHALGELARKLTEGVARLQSEAKTGISREDRDVIVRQLPEVETNLGVLVEEALSIKAEAKARNLRGIERDADSLSQSMQAMRKRLASVIEQLSDGPVQSTLKH